MFLNEENLYLITAALPYINNVPHIGHIVGTHLPADILARFYRAKGKTVVFLGGTDENGTTSLLAAREIGVSVKEYCDVLHKVHKKIYDWFWISYDVFGRTSSQHHHSFTKKMFLEIKDNGFISEGYMDMYYCPNCKIFLPDRFIRGTCPYCGYENARGDQCERCGRLLETFELINPKCVFCGTRPILKKSKHLFLDLQKLSDKLESWIKENRHWNKETRNLALGWIKEGLKKRCITRDISWGVGVPLKGYEDKVLYVWFDAPIGYISFLMELDPKYVEKIWRKGSNAKIFHIIGKDNIPFHTIFWPAMLFAAEKYNLPYDVIGLSYLNYEGKKISKSKKIGVFCDRIVESELDSDVWRGALIFFIPEGKDTDFKWDLFKEKINHELVSDFSNFVYRTTSFAAKNFPEGVEHLNKYDSNPEEKLYEDLYVKYKKITTLLERKAFREAYKEVINISRIGNKYLNSTEPWKTIKTNKEKTKNILWHSLNVLLFLSVCSNPFLPKTARKIWETLSLGGSPEEKGIWMELPKKRLPQKVIIKKPLMAFRKIDEKTIEKLKEETTKPKPLVSYFDKQ